MDVQKPKKYVFWLDTKGGEKTNLFDLWFKNVISGSMEIFQIEWGKTFVVGVIQMIT